MGLSSRLRLGAEVRGGRAALGEVTGEDWLEEIAEDDLSATTTLSVEAQDVKQVQDLRSLGQGHPKDEDELEGVVEGCRSLAFAPQGDLSCYVRNQ